MKKKLDVTEKIINMEERQSETIRSDILGWAEIKHQFDGEQVGAIQAAWLAERPLLIRGDPGLGKSQLAPALASFLKFRFNSITINADTEINDLLYRVDHIGRLSNAQNRGMDNSLEPYIQPGVIWKTLAPDTTAWDIGEKNNKDQATETKGIKGSLLLIDEIDKADASLPNALLEVLNNQTINVLPLNKKISREDNNLVFIVITSNDDRELPAAFLRRCAVLDLMLEEGRAGVEQLMFIYQAHRDSINAMTKYEGFNEQNNEEDNEVRELAEAVIEHRKNQKEKNDYASGTSEFLDLLRALIQYPKKIRQNKKDNLIKVLVNKRNQSA